MPGTQVKYVKPLIENADVSKVQVLQMLASIEWLEGTDDETDNSAKAVRQVLNNMMSVLDPKTIPPKSIASGAEIQDTEAKQIREIAVTQLSKLLKDRINTKLEALDPTKDNDLNLIILLATEANNDTFKTHINKSDNKKLLEVEAKQIGSITTPGTYLIDPDIIELKTTAQNTLSKSIGKLVSDKFSAINADSNDEVHFLIDLVHAKKITDVQAVIQNKINPLKLNKLIIDNAASLKKTEADNLQAKAQERLNQIFDKNLKDKITGIESVKQLGKPQIELEALANATADDKAMLTEMNKHRTFYPFPNKTKIINLANEQFTGLADRQKQAQEKMTEIIKFHVENKIIPDSFSKANTQQKNALINLADASESEIFKNLSNDTIKNFLGIKIDISKAKYIPIETLKSIQKLAQTEVEAFLNKTVIAKINTIKPDEKAQATLDALSTLVNASDEAQKRNALQTCRGVFGIPETILNIKNINTANYISENVLNELQKEAEKKLASIINYKVKEIVTKVKPDSKDKESVDALAAFADANNEADRKDALQNQRKGLGVALDQVKITEIHKLTEITDTDLQARQAEAQKSLAAVIKHRAESEILSKRDPKTTDANLLKALSELVNAGDNQGELLKALQENKDILGLAQINFKDFATATFIEITILKSIQKEADKSLAGIINDRVQQVVSKVNPDTNDKNLVVALSALAESGDLLHALQINRKAFHLNFDLLPIVSFKNITEFSNKDLLARQGEAQKALATIIQCRAQAEIIDKRDPKTTNPNLLKALSALVAAGDDQALFLQALQDKDIKVALGLGQIAIKDFTKATFIDAPLIKPIREDAENSLAAIIRYRALTKVETTIQANTSVKEELDALAKLSEANTDPEILAVLEEFRDVFDLPIKDIAIKDLKTLKFIQHDTLEAIKNAALVTQAAIIKFRAEESIKNFDISKADDRIIKAFVVLGLDSANDEQKRQAMDTIRAELNIPVSQIPVAVIKNAAYITGFDSLKVAANSKLKEILQEKTNTAITGITSASTSDQLDALAKLSQAGSDPVKFAKALHDYREHLNLKVADFPLPSLNDPNLLLDFQKLQASAQKNLHQIILPSVNNALATTKDLEVLAALAKGGADAKIIVTAMQAKRGELGINDAPFDKVDFGQEHTLAASDVQPFQVDAQTRLTEILTQQINSTVLKIADDPVKDDLVKLAKVATTNIINKDAVINSFDGKESRVLFGLDKAPFATLKFDSEHLINDLGFKAIQEETSNKLTDIIQKKVNPAISNLDTTNDADALNVLTVLASAKNQDEVRQAIQKYRDKLGLTGFGITDVASDKIITNKGADAIQVEARKQLGSALNLVAVVDVDKFAIPLSKKDCENMLRASDPQKFSESIAWYAFKTTGAAVKALTDDKIKEYKEKIFDVYIQFLDEKELRGLVYLDVNKPFDAFKAELAKKGFASTWLEESKIEEYINKALNRLFEVYVNDLSRLGVKSHSILKVQFDNLEPQEKLNFLEKKYNVHKVLRAVDDNKYSKDAAIVEKYFNNAKNTNSAQMINPENKNLSYLRNIHNPVVARALANLGVVLTPTQVQLVNTRFRQGNSVLDINSDNDYVAFISNILVTLQAANVTIDVSRFYSDFGLEYDTGNKRYVLQYGTIGPGVKPPEIVTQIVDQHNINKPFYKEYLAAKPGSLEKYIYEILITIANPNHYAINIPDKLDNFKTISAFIDALGIKDIAVRKLLMKELTYSMVNDARGLFLEQSKSYDDKIRLIKADYEDINARHNVMTKNKELLKLEAPLSDKYLTYLQMPKQNPANPAPKIRRFEDLSEQCTLVRESLTREIESLKVYEHQLKANLPNVTFKFFSPAHKLLSNITKSRVQAEADLQKYDKVQANITTIMSALKGVKEVKEPTLKSAGWKTSQPGAADITDVNSAQTAHIVVYNEDDKVVNTSALQNGQSRTFTMEYTRSGTLKTESAVIKETRIKDSTKNIDKSVFELGTFPKDGSDEDKVKYAMKLAVEGLSRYEKYRKTSSILPAFLANMFGDKAPSKSHKIILEGDKNTSIDSGEELKYVWTALRILGVDKDAIALKRPGTFNPKTEMGSLFGFSDSSLATKVFDRYPATVDEFINELESVGTSEKTSAEIVKAHETKLDSALEESAKRTEVSLMDKFKGGVTRKEEEEQIRKDINPD